ncbi:glycine cleavage system protein T [Desulfuribacillus stibiiarsenatis]|uniref:Aminomethyltransferase n=1 Tax=Desulfuribacillus stibiiarsenatis TaxID=1390249 RepID=A0A1E5L645_9FIRM|nr:glycine cleavage system aminomethyltransferase GcvT [Desulfuribacillus stibiiarsenatis]OEH85632.1 glycine cleavage system protein T [Desulfuribacillus stibiiarsenatis]
MENLQKTPLYPLYEKYGGKIIDFHGWALPVQFQGIIDEHRAVRTAAGFFDVSHMGEIVIKGKDAERFINHLVTNEISKMRIGQALYAIMCYEHGGAIDDLIVYKLSDIEFLCVVNASNNSKDYQWMITQKETESFDVEILNQSNDIAQFAIQGPLASQILRQMTDAPIDTIKKFRFEPHLDICGTPCLVSRTGYTGEDGFEIYVKNDKALDLAEKVLQKGMPMGLLPIGLGARDTLRLEATLPLYSQELSESITPIEAGLERFVKLDKDDFIGRQALSVQKREGVNSKIIGLRMIERGIPRSGYPVCVDDKQIGYVTSGTLAPTLQEHIGLAYIVSEYASIGQTLAIEIRGKKVLAEVIELPFLKSKNK